MILQQITCETAAKCEQLATAQQQLVLDGILLVAIIAVIIVLVQLHRSEKAA